MGVGFRLVAVGVPGAARAGSAVRRRCQADIRGLGTSWPCVRRGPRS